VGGSDSVDNTYSDGVNITGPPGVYFARGLSPANFAGGRNSASSAIDSSGNLWMFGGTGVDSKGNPGYLNDLWEWVEGTPTPAPTFNLPQGSYGGVQSVTISDTAAGANIFYTTDGTSPTVNSTLYQGPVTIDESSETLRAIAVATGDLPSAATSATYTLTLPATASPVLTPATGTYTTVQTVTMTDSTPNSAISYITNGDIVPIPYTGAFQVFNPGINTVIATAVAPAHAASATTTAVYNLILPRAAAPVIALPAGTYPSGQTVTITDNTPGAVIYYTTNGSIPSTNSAKYTGPITLIQNASIFAMASAYGYSNSEVAESLYSVTLAPPVFTPPAGTYTSVQSVTLTDSFALTNPSPGVGIFYTTDGSTPNTNSREYPGVPLLVSSSETLKAIAVELDPTIALPSPVASATYTVNLQPAPPPTFTPGPGSYSTAQNVTISDSVPGASIYYTTDASTPTVGATLYNGPVTMSTSQTIQAVAIAFGYTESAVASAAYTVNAPQVAAPSFSVGGGVYSSPQTVTITSATPGAAIYYAIGATPTISSTLYTAPIAVSSREIVEAIAVFPGYRNSAEVSATYTINATTATLSVAGADPYNMGCAILGPGTAGQPGPTGTATFTDITTGRTLGTEPLSTSYLSTIYQHLNNTAGNAPQGMLSADFNGDGKLDLAVANVGSNTVSILLGNGDGTFQPQVVYQVGALPSGIVAADLNGDGKLDLVVANSSSNTVSILLGNGDGTFTGTADNPATGMDPASIAVGDFNGDGKLDLAVTNSGDNTVSILLANGDGTFQPQTTFAVGKVPVGVVAGLFSGSSQPLDLVVVNERDSSLSVLVGNGDGTFQPESVISGEVGSNPTLIGTHDFNGDGKPDLIVFAGDGEASVSGQVTVLLGNGDGTFQSSSLLLTQSIGAPFRASGLDIGYFDGSNLEIAVANSGHGNILVYTSIGNGELTGPSNFAFEKAYGVVAGHLNGGGGLDIAATDGVQNVTVLLSVQQANTEALLSNYLLSPGTTTDHNIQCTYPGDGNYGPSTSNTVMEPFTQAGLPQFSLLVGIYPGSQSVSIMDSSPRAVIYYTTDGTNPTTSSTVYTQPITVSSTTTLKAIAAGPYVPSLVAEAVYTIANAPQFSAVAGGIRPRRR
jgi:hypothetical protein